MQFSTSSPTSAIRNVTDIRGHGRYSHPAEVYVVASHDAKGTFSTRASVFVIKVLPVPVGPIISTLLFSISTLRCALSGLTTFSVSAVSASATGATGRNSSTPLPCTLTLLATSPSAPEISTRREVGADLSSGAAVFRRFRALPNALGEFNVGGEGLKKPSRAVCQFASLCTYACPPQTRSLVSAVSS